MAVGRRCRGPWRWFTLSMVTDSPQPTPRVTVRKIAELSGVSVATVSRVLNNRADVAGHTRRLVQEVARSYGYESRGSPPPDAQPGRDLVGITLPFTHPTYFSSILSGAVEALYHRGMRAVVCPTGHEHRREASLIDALSHGETLGSVLILPEESAAELEHVADQGFKVVVVDPRHELDGSIPVVSAANAPGATQVTEHLLDLGHRRIGVITGPPDGLASRHRRLGYRAALAGAGVMPDPDLEVAGDFRVSGGTAAARRLLSLADPPTAIFAFNDAMAAGAMQAARQAGLRLPGQLSVVGFDDTVEASVAYPPLTTVHQPLTELGRMAVGLLARLCAGEVSEPLRVELATRLVLRASTAPPGRQ
jgi:LacI family transcriptional regulator